MPEGGDNTYDYPERLLAGSDRPRPLPPHLRARLEEALEGMATTTSARPLSGEVRDKLEVSLRPEAPRGPEKKWREWAPRLSVAAAVIIALAIFVPALTHGPGPAASHSAAGPLSTRSGLSMRAATPGALVRPDHGGAAASSTTAPVSSTTPAANGAAGNANGPAGNANAPTPTIPSARLAPTDDFGPAHGLGARQIGPRGAASGVYRLHAGSQRHQPGLGANVGWPMGRGAGDKPERRYRGRFRPPARPSGERHLGHGAEGANPGAPGRPCRRGSERAGGAERSITRRSLFFRPLGSVGLG